MRDANLKVEAKQFVAGKTNFLASAHLEQSHVQIFLSSLFP